MTKKYCYQCFCQRCIIYTHSVNYSIILEVITNLKKGTPRHVRINRYTLLVLCRMKNQFGWLIYSKEIYIFKIILRLTRINYIKYILITSYLIKSYKLNVDQLEQN